MQKKRENKPNQDDRNILKEETKIPSWWSKPGTKEEDKKTFKKIHQKRKTEAVPHISYDLDGDGFVGGRDLVIAKHFDEDKDGRLNTAEKEKAMKALQNGFEDNFVWGIEQSGACANHRIL